MPTPSISVVVVSRNEGPHLKSTIASLEATLPPRAAVVVVDDGSEDGSTEFLARRKGRVRLFQGPLMGTSIGVTRARNFGASECAGDIVIFSDAHMQYPGGWWQPLVAALEDRTVGAVAPMITDTAGTPLKGCGLDFKDAGMTVRWRKRGRSAKPREALILPGACFAMRRDVFRATGGWDEGMLHRGNVDNEISVRLWLLGYRLMVAPESVAGHLFRKASPYPVGWPQYLHNRLRLAFVHFKPERIARVIAALSKQKHLGEALLLVAASDAAKQRKQMAARRCHDDDWLFQKFGLRW